MKKKVYFLLFATALLCNHLLSQQTRFPEIVKKNNLVGLIDSNGRYVLPPEYDSIELKYDYYNFIAYRYYLVYKGKQLNFYEQEQGGLYTNGWFQQLKTNRTWQNTPYKILQKNGKYGLVELRSFRELVQFMYDDLFFTGDFMYPKLAEQGKDLPEALTHANGYRIFQTFYMIYKRNGLFGILEVTGTEITPPVYTSFEFVIVEVGGLNEVFLKCIGQQKTDYYNFKGKLTENR